MAFLSLFFYKILSVSKKRKYSNYCDFGSGHIFFDPNSIACFFAALPPIIVAAIRFEVGTDYVATYQSGFLRILKGDYSDGFEKGYFLLNLIVQKITTNPQGIFIITSIIFISFVYLSIYDNSTNIPLSICLFFISRYYFIGMNCVRQFIALSILLYATKYIFKRDFKSYLIFFILAVLFHSTVLIFFPAYFLYNLELTKKNKIIIIISTLFVGVSFRTIIDIFLAGTKYQRLMNKFNTCGIKFTLFTIFFNLIILFVFDVYRKKNNNNRIDKIINKSDYYILNYYYNIQFISVAITFLLQSIPLVERLYWTYSFGTIISIPYFLNKENNKIKRGGIILGLGMIYVIYFIYDIIILKDHEVLPYRTFF